MLMTFRWKFYRWCICECACMCVCVVLWYSILNKNLLTSLLTPSSRSCVPAGWAVCTRRLNPQRAQESGSHIIQATEGPVMSFSFPLFCSVEICWCHETVLASSCFGWLISPWHSELLRYTTSPQKRILSGPPMTLIQNKYHNRRKHLPFCYCE